MLGMLARDRVVGTHVNGPRRFPFNPPLSRRTAGDAVDSDLLLTNVNLCWFTRSDASSALQHLVAQQPGPAADTQNDLGRRVWEDTNGEC